MDTHDERPAGIDPARDPAPERTGRHPFWSATLLLVVLVTAAAGCPNGDDDGPSARDVGPVPTEVTGEVDDGDGPGPLDRRTNEWYGLYRVGNFEQLRAQLDAVRVEPPADVDPEELDAAVTVFDTLVSLNESQTATAEQIAVVTDLGARELGPSLELAVTAALTEAADAGLVANDQYVQLVDPVVVSELVDDDVIELPIVPPGVVDADGAPIAENG